MKKFTLFLLLFFKFPFCWKCFIFFVFLTTNAPTEGVLLKKVLLETSQNSQENIWARLPFLIKLQTRNFCESSKNTFFTEHLETTASANWTVPCVAFVYHSKTGFQSYFVKLIFGYSPPELFQSYGQEVHHPTLQNNYLSCTAVNGCFEPIN